MSNININQFSQVAVLGQLDLGISRSGILQGMVSAAAGATAIKAGDAVLLDPAVTVVGAPQFIPAASTDIAIGYMVYDVQNSSALTPNYIQVAMFPCGPVMWLLAGATIAPGAFVEQTAVAGTVVTYATTTTKVRGIALDPGVTGQLLRVILLGAQKTA